MNRSSLFRRWFEDLMAGDAVAWTVAGVLAVFLLIVGAVCLKVKLDWMREEEAKKNKYRRPVPKSPR